MDLTVFMLFPKLLCTGSSADIIWSFLIMLTFFRFCLTRTMPEYNNCWNPVLQRFISTMCNRKVLPQFWCLCGTFSVCFSHWSAVEQGSVVKEGALLISLQWNPSCLDVCDIVPCVLRCVLVLVIGSESNQEQIHTWILLAFHSLCVSNNLVTVCSNDVWL